MLLPKDKDPMGAAIADYHRTGRASTLRVFSSQFDEDEIPVDTLFRTLADMPSIEQRALAMARGKILDVGAGSGCHALALQKMGKEVTAIDISELSVEVMQERGVEDARAIDLYDEHFMERYDTIPQHWQRVSRVASTARRSAWSSWRNACRHSTR